MKRLITIAAVAALFMGTVSFTPALAQGKGGGGRRGQQSGPKDGTGQQKGKGQKGKRTGPQDGTGPIHDPPKK
ncbi:MAG: hypothetical protein U0Q16_01345 [Bryobacteraceae bacterium]